MDRTARVVRSGVLPMVISGNGWATQLALERRAAYVTELRTAVASAGDPGVRTPVRLVI